eukprot:6765591-Pyramimonas_sp.AAC.1
MASDASPRGRGVVEGERDPALVQRAGRVNERWRCSKDGELSAKARLHARCRERDDYEDAGLG